MKALLAITATALALTGCGESYEDQLQRTCGSKNDAYRASTDFVRGQLASPSTASFPNSAMDLEVSVSAIDECTKRVSAQFDAQNAFGAMIRSNYEAVVRYDRPARDWRLVELNIR